MKITVQGFLAACAFAFLLSNALASDNPGKINSKEIKYLSTDDYVSLSKPIVNEGQKSIEELLKKIAVLESVVSSLSDRVVNLENLAAGPKASDSRNISEKNTSQNIAASNIQNSNAVSETYSKTKLIGEGNIAGEDIFAIAEKTDHPSESISKTPAQFTPSFSSQQKKSVGEKADYDMALADLKDNKLDLAEKKFWDFINKYPKSSMQSNAYFWYSETFFRRNIFDKAAIYYLKGYKQFPKGAKASDSLLKLALSLGSLNKKSDACNILIKLDQEFPNRPSSSIKRAKDARIKFGCN
jgi:tol-pal system protein YbgF